MRFLRHIPAVLALTAIAAVCLLMTPFGAAFAESALVLTTPDPNVVQAGPFLQFVTQFVYPTLAPLLAALVGWAIWEIKKRTGLQIEAQYRDAFQKALEQAAGGLLNNLGTRAATMTVDVHNAAVAQAINYVLKAAPDAVTHFGLDNKRDEIAEKLANKVGVLTAGPPAVSIASPPTEPAPAKPSVAAAPGAQSG